MDNIKHWLDLSAAATAFGALVGILPHIASLLSIIWLCIQIGEYIRKKRKECANEL
jgi:hypothetical protein